jgi:hypothetical protein
VYFFIRHKVHRIPGAYSYYSLFEWGLVLIDVAFDAVGAGDVGRLQVRLPDYAEWDVGLICVGSVADCVP